MANKSKHEGAHALAQLQTNLRRSETIRGALTAIGARDIDGKKFTIGDHNYSPVKKRSLVLKEDPNGNLPAPDGTTLVVRGTAYVGSSEKEVAIFRLP